MDTFSVAASAGFSVVMVVLSAAAIVAAFVKDRRDSAPLVPVKE